MSLKLKKNPQIFCRQRGFLVPVAIFIVVVMSLFAIALWRMTVQTSLSSAQELINTQAFYAAESGAQFGMNKLFDPANAVSRSIVNNQCASLNGGPDLTGVIGLNNCSVDVSCVCSDCGAGDVTSFYTITSIGSCGSGLISAVRTVKVGSFMDQE